MNPSLLSGISILGDFNVHYFCLSSIFINLPVEQTFNFAILSDLDQLIQHPSRIPDCLGNHPNVLDLFLTFHPSAYANELFSPLECSDHNLISVSCPTTPVRPFVLQLEGPDGFIVE